MAALTSPSTQNVLAYSHCAQQCGTLFGLGDSIAFNVDGQGTANGDPQCQRFRFTCCEFSILFDSILTCGDFVRNRFEFSLHCSALIFNNDNLTKDVFQLIDLFA
jgi:hypothetical protein